MGVIAHSPPNYAAAFKSLGVEKGPVVTQTFTHLPLYSKVCIEFGWIDEWNKLSSHATTRYTQVNGIMNMVFAYGGAMIFP